MTESAEKSIVVPFGGVPCGVVPGDGVPKAGSGQPPRRRRCWMTALLALGMVVAWGRMASQGADAKTIADDVLTRWGADVGFKTFCGEPWRLLAAPFLHYGWADLMFNLAALWAVGRWVERQAGALGLLTAFLISGALAGAVATRLDPSFAHVASFGALAGLLGVWWGLVLRRRLEPAAGRRRWLVLWTILFAAAAGASEALGYADLEGTLAALGAGLAMGLWLREPLCHATSRAFGARLAIGAAACAMLAGVLLWDFSGGSWLLDQAQTEADSDDGAEAAIAYYGQYLKRHSGDAEALAGRAETQASLGRGAAARRDFDAAVAAAPKDSYPLAHRGRFRVEHGDLAGGRRDLDAALALDPKDADALDARAQALMEAGDDAGAAADLRREVTIEPTDARARYNLAYCLGRLEQWAESAKEIQESMRLKKGQAGAWAILAEAYLGQGLDYQGLEAANYALKIAGADRELTRHVYFQRGFLNYRVGDNRQAEADWREAAALTPDAHDRAGTLENVGLVLTRSGRWREALANCDAVDRLAPDMAWNALFRAIAADKLGQMPVARRAYALWRVNRGPSDASDLDQILPDSLRGYLAAPPASWTQDASSSPSATATPPSGGVAPRHGATAANPDKAANPVALRDDRER